MNTIVNYPQLILLFSFIRQGRGNAGDFRRVASSTADSVKLPSGWSLSREQRIRSYLRPVSEGCGLLGHVNLRRQGLPSPLSQCLKTRSAGSWQPAWKQFAFSNVQLSEDTVSWYISPCWDKMCSYLCPVVQGHSLLCHVHLLGYGMLSLLYRCPETWSTDSCPPAGTLFALTFVQLCKDMVCWVIFFRWNTVCPHLCPVFKGNVLLGHVHLL